MGAHPTAIEMISAVCRVCLSDEEPPLFNLFDGEEPGITLREMYTFVTGYPLVEGDRWPQNLCFSCMSALTHSYLLRVEFEINNR